METGGKDSISYTPIGRKLFIILERGMNSVMLEKHIRNVFNFIRSVKAGPPSATSQSKDCIKYYIPHSSHFLCQPAFCLHSVRTSSTGPSLVLGWKACWEGLIKFPLLEFKFVQFHAICTEIPRLETCKRISSRVAFSIS